MKNENLHNPLFFRITTEDYGEVAPIDSSVIGSSPVSPHPVYFNPHE